mmetsp:Transcript_6906/g.10554  ORF Transcript_6906/g.10554 Transcript_6906/m.10554 type:complete len:88 (+) Transcript_6906:1463-1726(+)
MNAHTMIPNLHQLRAWGYPVNLLARAKNRLHVTITFVVDAVQYSLMVRVLKFARSTTASLETTAKKVNIVPGDSANRRGHVLNVWIV